MSEAQTEQPMERDVALRKAYQSATNDLRKANLKEFNDLYAKHAAALGHEWKPKPTPDEKARQQMQALLAEHPELAEELAPKQSGDPFAG